MNCTYCSSIMTDDCRYCPVCGQPTALLSEHSTLKFPASGAAATAAESSSAASPSAAELVPAIRTGSAFAAGDSLDGEFTEQKVEALVVTKKSEAQEEGNAEGDDAFHTLLTQANLARIRGRWEEAINLCVSVLRAHPGNLTAHSLLGDIYRDQGKTDDAIQWYRMAVDLQPNPSDKAKLEHMERIRSINTSRRFGDGQSARLALDPDGGLPTGTARLLGVSPRSWLNGLLVTSLVFLLAVLGLLIVMQNNRRGLSNVPHPASSGGAINSATSGSPLPPGRVGGAGGESSSGSPVKLSGQGFGPDARTNPETGPTTKPETQESVPTAPAGAVRPLNTAPSGGTSALEGGMHLVDSQKDAANGSVTLTIAAPAGSPHAALVRNVYRAARGVFNQDASLTRATVIIQNPAASAGDSAPAPLFLTEVDRIAVNQVNPGTDAAERLESLLRNPQWPGQEPADGVKDPPNPAF